MKPAEFQGRTGKILIGIQVPLGLLVIIVALGIIFYFMRLRFTANPPRLGNSTAAPSASTSISVIEEGLNDAALQSFPKLVYSEANFLEKGGCCSICLADYVEKDVVRLLPYCGHFFHQMCVDPWLRLRPTCPNCRTSPIPTPLATPLGEVTPLAWH
ncbi:hypothetical protein UlMin_025236 [Ulmus minor]